VALHDAVERRLEAHDQRYTPMRRLLVEALAASGRPLTVPEILDRAPGLPQSSAYRNVTALLDAGVVRKVATADDHWRVELAEELAGHHHHLVCGTCGRVEDVPPSASLERALGETARIVAERTGFVVNEHRLDLVGTCATCDAAAGAGATPATQRGRSE
jgi:Fe2+ or Zn2+ uptake regulation protein